MTPFPPLFVLRHGQTEWNRGNRLQGHLDSPLTDLGRAQAARQGAILRRILPTRAVAIASDSGRAQATAHVALRGLGVPLTLDARLREVALGDWQGLTPSEVASGWPERIAGDEFDWKFRAPGGETLADLEARARAVLEALTGPTVLVTHGLTSRVLRCLALGRPLDEMRDLPGGQGVVHVIASGVSRTVSE